MTLYGTPLILNELNVFGLFYGKYEVEISSIYTDKNNGLNVIYMATFIWPSKFVWRWLFVHKPKRDIKLSCDWQSSPFTLRVFFTTGSLSERQCGEFLDYLTQSFVVTNDRASWRSLIVHVLKKKHEWPCSLVTAALNTKETECLACNCRE